MAGRVLILSGGGDHADPWHSFLETSEAIGVLLEADGFEVQLAVQVDRELARLAPRAPEQPALFDEPEPRTPDLVVVNAARAEGDEAIPSPAAREGLRSHLARGGGLLAVHAATVLWPGWEDWERILGGRWVAGRSWHPDLGPARVLLGPTAHPITADLEGRDHFDLVDERYSDLRVSPEAQQLAWHEYGGVHHPLLWAREVGPARVAVDLLGHDLRSYASAERRALLLGAARWAARA